VREVQTPAAVPVVLSLSGRTVVNPAGTSAVLAATVFSRSSVRPLVSTSVVVAEVALTALAELVALAAAARAAITVSTDSTRP
jgi:hypothetical protein